MEKESISYQTPAIGCLVGTAYQVLQNDLATALRQKGINISAAEYLVMRAVYSEEGLQPCDVARVVGKDQASVCRSVASLVKKGLLKTESVSHKCLRLFLTEEGRGLREGIMEVAKQRHEALVGMIGQSNLKNFEEVLGKIIRSRE